MTLNKEIKIIAEQAKIFQVCLLNINKIAKDNVKKETSPETKLQLASQ